MSYEDLSGGISEHEAGEEFMEKEDERLRDQQLEASEKELLALFRRHGPLWLHEQISDWMVGELVPETPDARSVWEAMDSYTADGEPRKMSFARFSKWLCQQANQQKAKGSAA